MNAPAPFLQFGPEWNSYAGAQSMTAMTDPVGAVITSADQAMAAMAAVTTGLALGSALGFGGAYALGKRKLVPTLIGGIIGAVVGPKVGL